MSQPALSVIVVSYNTRDLTLECLTRLHEALSVWCAGKVDDHPAYDETEARPEEEEKFDVCVVDNGSHDGSAAAIRERFPDVRLIVNPANRGFGAANNQAVERASGDYLLLLNSDAFLDADAIENLLARMQAHPQAALVGPQLRNGDGSLQPSCYRFPGGWRIVCESLLLTALWPDHPLMGDYRAWPHDHERYVDFVSGACLLVRREAVCDVGGFDEQFFFYAEETDWCKRFQNAGWRVLFTPHARVTHLGGRSGTAQPDRVFEEFRRGQERWVRKHGGWAGLQWYRGWVVIGACVRLGVWGASGILRPQRRSGLHDSMILWRRILRWTLGFRGPGLREAGQSD